MYSKKRFKQATSLCKSISSIFCLCAGDAFVAGLMRMRLADLLLAKLFKDTPLGSLDASVRLYGGNVLMQDHCYGDIYDLYDLLRDTDRDWPIFRYFKHSPFWTFNSYAMYDGRLADESGRICASYSSMATFIKESLPVISEEDEILYGPLLDDLMGLFRGDYNVDGDVFVISSILLKYFFLANQQGVFGDDPLTSKVEEEINNITDAFSDVLDHSCNTFSLDAHKLHSQHIFISCDWTAAAGYYYPGMVTEISPKLMFTGYLVDSLIFQLDEKYHFLPQEMRDRKEKFNYG